MKKSLFIAFLLLGAVSLFAQVPRDKVIVEIGTGTWCTYCPGAAMGADDLIANGWPVAIIENHNGDPFSNTYSDARNNYYNITGFPTAYFDGQNAVVGGSHTQSMYPSYYPKVQARMNVQSPLTISAWGSHVNLTYNVTVHLEAAQTISGSDIRLHVAVTESDIQYAWQGMTECNFVNRLMVPDQSGTVVDLNANPILEVPLTFNLQAGWLLPQLELVIFVQNNTSKEILQGYKVKLAFLMPPPPPLAASFTSDITEVCEGSNVQFEDQSTGGPIEWYWEFPGGTPDTSREENPLIEYDVPGKYDVTLQVIKNGDTSIMVMPEYVTVNTLPMVTFDPIDDQCVNYTAFALTQGMPEGGTYSGPGVVDNTFDPSVAGIGTHTLVYTYADTNSCENYAEQTVVVDACTGVPENGIAINAMPNPTNGTFQLTLAAKSQSVSYKIMNSTGMLVTEKSNIAVDGQYATSIDLSTYSNGIYYILVQADGSTYFKKVVLNR